MLTSAPPIAAPRKQEDEKYGMEKMPALNSAQEEFFVDYGKADL